MTLFQNIDTINLYFKFFKYIYYTNINQYLNRKMNY